MTAQTNSAQNTDATLLLAKMRSRGVSLWLEEGQLRYRAPRNALSEREVERIRSARRELIALLERVGKPQPTTANGMYSAPLAYSQLQHWNFYRLDERCSYRWVAYPLRLVGPMNVELFSEAVRAMVHRHDALRTQFTMFQGVPIQRVAPSSSSPLVIEDLSATDMAKRTDEVNRWLDQVVLERIDVKRDPLYSIALLRFAPDDHVLIIAMEHLITDMTSVFILVRELLSAYGQLVRGGRVTLPAVRTQMTQYAAAQVRDEGAWLSAHRDYWERRLAGCGRQRFPVDPRAVDRELKGWRVASFWIGSELKSRLQEWCRRRGTTLVMAVFTAFVAAVLRRCGVADSVVQFQSNGRVDDSLDETIGYVASPLCLRVQLFESDRFMDLLSRVMEEYCATLEHADFSYLAAQSPRPEYTCNATFNWIPDGTTPEVGELVGTAQAIACIPLSFVNPVRTVIEKDIEPQVLMFDRPNGVEGACHFPLNRFSLPTMQAFGDDMIRLLEGMVGDPDTRVTEVRLNPWPAA